MANEQHRPKPPQGGSGTAPAKADRGADVERLAASLYADLLRQYAGQKTPAGVAREALSAAREFYRALDTPEPTKE